MRTGLLLILLALMLYTPLKGQPTADSTLISQDYATIYFYRKQEFYNGRFECWVDQIRLVSNFSRGSYFWLNLPAGDYEIRTKGIPKWIISEKKYQLKVESGQVYYIEAVVDYDFLGTALFLKERSQTAFNQQQSKLTFDARAKRTLE